VSVGYNREPYRSGQTGQGAIWDIDSDGPKEPCFGWEFRSTRGMGNFGGHLLAHLKYREYLIIW